MELPPSHDRGPLAPVSTPAPRPLGEDEGASRTSDPRSDADPSDDEPSPQLIDLTGGGGGAAPADPDDAAAPSGLARSLAKLASTAGAAVQRFAFPLSLTVLVLVFLLIQGEIDRRDPKLAFAPVDSSKEMVHFE